MLATVASMLVGRFGPNIFTYIYRAIIIVLGTLVGTLYFYNWGLTTDIENKTQKLAETNAALTMSKAALETAEKNLQHYKDEYDRVSLIADKATETRTEIVYVEKVVTREVIKYQNDPSIKRVSLPAEWVCIHDYAARGNNPFTGTGETESKTIGFKDYRCVNRESIPDHTVLEVMSYNYNQCQVMQANYQELSDIVFGYLEKIEALENK